MCDDGEIKWVVLSAFTMPEVCFVCVSIVGDLSLFRDAHNNTSFLHHSLGHPAIT